MSARFEGATLLGLGAGFAVAPIAFAAFGPTAFFLNAVVYGVSFLIFWTVKDPAGESAAVKAPHVGLRRYVELIRSSHVWLLAPTWIAVNASIGLWFSQSIFQFAKANPEFPDQVLMRRVHGGPDLGGGRRHRDHLRRRPALLGEPLQVLASHHDHPVRHPRRCWAGRSGHRHQPLRRSRRGSRARRRSRGRVRVVRDGRRDASGTRVAGRHLRALPPRPRRDHGPLLGVPGRRPDHRRPHRRSRGRCARHRRDAHRHRRPARRRPHPARPAAARRGELGIVPTQTDPQT